MGPRPSRRLMDTGVRGSDSLVGRVCNSKKPSKLVARGSKRPAGVAAESEPETRTRCPDKARGSLRSGCRARDLLPQNVVGARPALAHFEVDFFPLPVRDVIGIGFKRRLVIHLHANTVFAFLGLPGLAVYRQRAA